jgi:hypothetical protein
MSSSWLTASCAFKEGSHMSPAQFEYDRAGFPMIWVEEVHAYVHWLPITKIQFEHFLCDITDSTFDAAWYDRLLALNPRISPRDVNDRNYWRAFVTALLPVETERFARWCGEDYGLPTLSEWFTVYKALKALPRDRPEWSESMPLRVRSLLSRVETAWERAASRMNYPETRADQMLMRLGVLEWIQDPSNGYQWGGMGQPHPSFHGILITPENGKPARPLHPETDRLSSYGFRLLRRVR